MSLSLGEKIVGRVAVTARDRLVQPLTGPVDEILIDPGDPGVTHAGDGEIVVAEITRPPVAGRMAVGRVIEVLGREETPGIDLEIIVRKHELPHVFPDEALAEAETVPDSVTTDKVNGRVDLRDWPSITIDRETARDFDDAVSIEATPDRYRLGVHIADVGHYVREGTALDREAFLRGTSVYFPERAIPMLPEKLSNGVCSLNPRQDRLTLSVLMEIDREGRIVDYRLTPSVIHSVERMTYTSVNQIISNPNGEVARTYAHIRDIVHQMHDLALILIKRRAEEGAIDLDLPEAELLFNDEGQICGIIRSERNIAHRIIEEFMLLANETVARHLEALRVPSIYRIHEGPNLTRLEEFAEIAESFGHGFTMHGPVPQRGFQHLLREVKGRPEERMLSYLMLRSMERARYSAQNSGHFGLAMRTYTHFTSPIRRYPDLAVHRVLRRVLEIGGLRRIDLGKQALGAFSGPVLDESEEIDLRSSLDEIAEHSSERERVAAAAENELIDWRRAAFMAERLGDQFEAVITSVRPYGFFVELIEQFVEGLVHISTLKEDTYEFEERRHRLVGLRTGRVFKLGDSVRVAVDRVDRIRHLVDFSLARDLEI